ncbi:hypothetical protein PFISCL1PPCAC_12980, partial [Pristionchus fissidentatus]
NQLAMASWIVGIRFHLLISFNRFIAIIFPLHSRKYITAKSTKMAVAFIIILSIIFTSPLILAPGVWFCYDHADMRWLFAQNQRSIAYAEFGMVRFVHVQVWTHPRTESPEQLF